MNDTEKTQEQLIEELAELRRRIGDPRYVGGESRHIQRQGIHREVRHGLRDAVTQMQSSNDIQHVLAVLKEGLHQLGIPFQDCGINLIDPEHDPTVVGLNSLGKEGEWKEPEQAWGQDLVFQFWKEGVPVYRRDLEAEDLYGERQGYLDYFGHPVRCVLDIPFAYGTLAVNSEKPDAFSPDDIAELELLAVVLEEGFQRVEDLRNLEQRHQALQESEERYRRLVELSPEAIYIHVDGRFVFANQAGIHLLGGERPEDLLGKPILDFVHPDYRPLVTERVRQITTESTKVPLIEEKFIRLDGGIINVEVTAIPFTYRDRSAVQVVVRDITRRQQAERHDRLARDVLSVLNHSDSARDTIHAILQLIKKSTDIEAVGIRLREGDDFPYYQTNGFPDHFVQMGNSLCARDEAGEVVRDLQGNPVLECMCGNILCGRINPQFLFFTEGGSFWSNCTTDLLTSTTEKDRQAHTRNSCNGEGYESLALIPLRVGNEIIGLLQLNDHRRDQFSLEMIRFFEGLGDSVGIALHRKQAEEELKEKTRLNQILLDAFPCVALLLRPYTREIVTSNKAAAQVGAVPGRQCYSTWGQRNDSCPWCLAPEVWSTGEPRHTEIKALDMVWDAYWIPVSDDLYMHFAFDITEHKQMEQELIRLERLRAVGELSAGVSHNLNNILTTVLGPAQILKRKSDDPELLREVNDIITSATRARDLVHELHLSVRTQEEESLQPVAISKVIEEAVQTSRPRWKDEPEAQGVSIKILTRGEGVPPIEGTEAGLHDILTNFIFNAVDAMPEGGAITIETRTVGDHVQITFSDTGKGMDEATKLRIFEPFFTTKMDLGTGLGLSTAYNTVNRWGGTIEVESAPGEGTTFILRFPVWKEEIVAEERKEAAQSTRPGKVLVVDDDEAICSLLLRLLGEQHEVEAVNDGRKALERFAPGEYDVVMIDLGMSGMSGDQLLKQIKELDPQVATVLSTGWALPGTDVRVSSFDFRITKPFEDLDEIKDVVARAIALRDERVVSDVEREDED